MSEQQTQSKDIDGVSIIGFRINAESKGPDVYTLMTYGAIEAPVVVEGQLLFFGSPSLAATAYEFLGDDVKNSSSPPTEIDAICDLASMLHIINHQGRDETATVVNCLNTLFDLVTATRTTMPGAYKKILYDFADHLTFNQEFADYIHQRGLNKATITDAVLWCIGAVVINSKVLTS